MRGRKPKPTTLRILEGNPGKRSLIDGPPQAPAKIPECPCFLDDEARAEWLRMAPVLLEMGLLTPADRAALAAYCIS